MKTEGLTLVEAWQALLDGKCVCNKLGDRFKIVDGIKFHWDNSRKWIDSNFYNMQASHYEPYSIVEDPSIEKPKSLSFDEAAEVLKEGKMIRVKHPYCHLSYNMHKFTAENVCFIELAINKGWPITLAE